MKFQLEFSKYQIMKFHEQGGRASGTRMEFFV